MEEPPFDQDRREMYALRVALGQQQGAFRARYGNKDGRAADGSLRRFDNPMWQRIEDALKRAQSEIFSAEKEIFSLPQTPAEGKETPVEA